MLNFPPVMWSGQEAMETQHLSMRGIGKAFSGVRVLDSVDFDLRAGEVHILAGENGAGKSTLIKILAGVYAEYEGEILLGGQPVRFRSPQHARRSGISVIHQELSLVPGMSVSDNVFLGREHAARGWVRRARQERECAALLARLGMEVTPSSLVGDHPISVQQSIEIAKAMAGDARVVVMDEPTSCLAAPEVERLFALIDGLRRQGCGIIYITHKMEEIYRIADRITVLRDGKKIGTAAACDLPAEQLVRWMVGRPLEAQFSRTPSGSGKVRLEVREFSVPDPAGLPRPKVDRVSFQAHAGEIIGIGGLQGSGGSELLAALFGVHGRRPTGEVFLDGAPVSLRRPASALREGVALLTNDRKTTGLVLGMSITRNMTLASLPRYSPGGWLLPGREVGAARGHAERFGIRAATLTQPVETLSGGNQQKVVLAKWLDTNPRVLLLDEPTRGVDVGAKHEIYELMNRWTSAGITILLITSEMPELLAMSDRILVLYQGRILREFGRGEATQESVLAAAMGREEGERK